MNFFLNLFIQLFLIIAFYFTLLFHLLLYSKWTNNVFIYFINSVFFYFFIKIKSIHVFYIRINKQRLKFVIIAAIKKNSSISTKGEKVHN